MTDTPARLAEAVAVVLAEPNQEVVALAAAPAAVAEDIRKRMAEIDMSNTQSIISFGAGAQSELQLISQDMLEGVKNKDVGPAGDALQTIVSTLRGFSVSELDVRRKQSWWEKLTGRAAPFAKFIAKFEEVQTQIDKVTDDLNLHEHMLLKDIKSLDLLYSKTLGFYDELALYIAAGEAKLADLDASDIPAKAALVKGRRRMIR